MTQVGELQVLPIRDGVGRGARVANLISPVAGAPDLWTLHPEMRSGEAMIALTHGGFVVRANDRVIVVDTGIGRVNNDVYDCGYFMENLEAAGLRADDVTDVVLTHLHADHIGWATQKNKPTFPKATYRVHANDWAYFIGGPGADEYVQRKLTPLHDRLELIDGSEVALAPGVDVRLTPGHTPGSTTVVLSSGTARAMLIGDVAHCPAELTEDQWECAFDVDRAAATSTRARLAREIEGTDVLIGAPHFPELGLGRLLTGTTTRKWTAL
ncbi:MAG: MBL fold metallo-hydrolase [Acidimicrobiia bacterium]